jgi:hypothetical protein
MVQFSVGDKVRIRGVPAGVFAGRHTGCEGLEGTVEKVDDSDGTLFIELDGAAGRGWFHQEGVEMVRRSADAEVFCSCGGPERIVTILFQPVRVCTVCKKEKS